MKFRVVGENVLRRVDLNPEAYPEFEREKNYLTLMAGGCFNYPVSLLMYNGKVEKVLFGTYTSTLQIDAHSIGDILDAAAQAEEIQIENREKFDNWLKEYWHLDKEEIKEMLKKEVPHGSGSKKQ